MAKYTFVHLRDNVDMERVPDQLRAVCASLTPRSIRGECHHIVQEWPFRPRTWLAVQNAPDRPLLTDGEDLVIGRILGEESRPDPTSDGSYAIVQIDDDAVRFYTDQFGSRTLWYYIDERMLVVSTSQRAVVQIKGSFNLNREALSWFLSSGCQGPFMSWDADVKQAEPRLEYAFDSSRWSLQVREKQGLSLPASSTERFEHYIKQYEAYAAAALSQIFEQERSAGPVLLPLSGGLDSRLLLSLAQEQGAADRVDLVNWGVPSTAETFDDKAAAKRVADSHEKPLLDAYLPEVPHDLDDVLDRFVEASEGRIDHFNAYTDAFEMWDGFYRAGYRAVVRGDIPFTEGVDIGEASARAHIGLSAFSDYANLADYDLGDLPSLQRPIEIRQQERESLVRWRDRLYVSWRVPMVISSFANLISGHVECHSPMMSWRLFVDYCRLPDRDKGDKKHIEALARAHDQSGVPFDATPALLPISNSFDHQEGLTYMRNYLAERCDPSIFPAPLIHSVLSSIRIRFNRHVTPHHKVNRKKYLKLIISKCIPSIIKGLLKARLSRRLSPLTLGYRLIIADKTVRMYRFAAADRLATGSKKVGTVPPLKKTPL